MEDLKHINPSVDVLDELKHQYVVFSKKAENKPVALTAETADIKNMSAKSIRKALSFKMLAFPVVLMLYTLFYLMHTVSFSFLIATFVLVILDAGGEYYLNRAVKKINIDTDLITYQLQLIKTKRLRAIKLGVLAPISIVWSVWFGLLQLELIGIVSSNVQTFLIAMTIAVTAGLSIEFYLYRKIQKSTDKLLASIIALKQ